MKQPSFPIEGGCGCGALRYRLDEDPLELHVCHCTDCQTVCGSAFVMSMAVHVRSLELLRGEPAERPFRTPGGVLRCDHRCTECGVRLWSVIQGLPDVRMLRPGTLDDTSWLDPIAHIWTSSAQPWVQIPDGVLRYEQQPVDNLELVRAWKERAGA